MEKFSKYTIDGYKDKEIVQAQLKTIEIMRHYYQNAHGRQIQVLLKSQCNWQDALRAKKFPVTGEKTCFDKEHRRAGQNPFSLFYL